MLRAIATIVIVTLFGLNWMLPDLEIGRRGSSTDWRVDVETTRLSIGEPMPDLALADLAGTRFPLSSLRGHPVLLVFERSIDWCPFTKARLLDLASVLGDTPDLEIVWVMAAEQVSERTRRLVDEFGLRDRILFLADEKSAAIRELGLLKSDPEVIEEGVPVPTTIVLDREGVVRFIDVRDDYHVWLDPNAILVAVEEVE
jgi:peroxiredoxin